jgi:hypothetical protein
LVKVDCTHDICINAVTHIDKVACYVNVHIHSLLTQAYSTAFLSEAHFQLEQWQAQSFAEGLHLNALVASSVLLDSNRFTSHPTMLPMAVFGGAA